MLDEKLERLRTHQRGIERYRRLLATRLSDLERAYIERRLSEEQASVRALLRETFPDRLFALRPRIEGRTNTLDMAALLHPGDAFDHPMDVVGDCAAPSILSLSRSTLIHGDSTWIGAGTGRP